MIKVKKKNHIVKYYNYHDLSNANFRNTNLNGLKLSYINLEGADFTNAKLYHTNFMYSNLSEANFENVNLFNSHTNFFNANLSGVKNFPNFPLACPEKGEFVGWKKANYIPTDLRLFKYVLVKLLIPEDALRSSGIDKKCRCNKAKVLDILNLDKTPCLETKVRSIYDYDFIYTKGETVEVESFDTDRWNRCSTGIHFFMNIEDAIKY